MEAEQRLRELLSRVKVARAVVSTTPRLAETLAADWQKAARFYASFGITEAAFRHGVSVDEGHASGERPADPLADFTERTARATASLPGAPPQQSST